MNGSLGISELEAARLRRQVDQIAHLVRSDEALPVPVFDIDRRGTDITLGAVKFKLEWTELGGGRSRKEWAIRLSNNEMERQLFTIFRDKDVTKKLYDHIFASLEKYAGEKHGTVERYGDTQFCG